MVFQHGLCTWFFFFFFYVNCPSSFTLPPKKVNFLPRSQFSLGESWAKICKMVIKKQQQQKSLLNRSFERQALPFSNALGGTRFYDCKRGETIEKQSSWALCSEQWGEFILMLQFLLRNDFCASLNTERILSLIRGSTSSCEHTLLLNLAV